MSMFLIPSKRWSCTTHHRVGQLGRLWRLGRGDPRSLWRPSHTCAQSASGCPGEDPRFVGVSSISVQRGFFLLKLLEGLSLDHGVYAALVRKTGPIWPTAKRIPRLRIAKAKSDEQSMAQLVEVLQDIHNGLTPPAVAGRNE